MDKNTINKIQELRENGFSYLQIAKELMITKSQATYFSKVNLKKIEEKLKNREKYENLVCEIAKKSRNFNQLCKVLGKHPTSDVIRRLISILEKYNINYSHFDSIPEKQEFCFTKKDINDYLVSGKTVSVTHLRDRLIKEGIKEYKCEKCGRTEWEGEPIPLQLHHINGNRTDNRLENLQILCPNCHAQTDNFSGRKLRKKQSIKPCKSKKVNISIPVEKLIDSFKKYGNFKSVSKEFDVSDKTISKWFKKIGMPDKSKELREYFILKYGPIKWDFLSGNANAFREYQKNNFKKICLMDNSNNIEKIYNSPSEVNDDGFNYKNVCLVCKGELKTHHKRIFKYL